MLNGATDSLGGKGGWLGSPFWQKTRQLSDSFRFVSDPAVFGFDDGLLKDFEDPFRHPSDSIRQGRIKIITVARSERLDECKDEVLSFTHYRHPRHRHIASGRAG
jgi:hypothetical protein